MLGNKLSLECLFEQKVQIATFNSWNHVRRKMEKLFHTTSSLGKYALFDLQ